MTLDQGESVRLRPDISWWEGETGDVKYKRLRAPGLQHSDLYQLLAYLTAADLSEGLLIYAAGEEHARTHMVRHCGNLLRVVTVDPSQNPEGILEQIRLIADTVRGVRERVSHANAFA